MIVEKFAPKEGASLQSLLNDLQDAISAVEVDESTGEVIGLDKVRAVGADTQEKILARGRAILTFTTMLEGMKDHRKQLSTRISALEKTLEYLKGSTADGMMALDIKKISDVDIALSFRESEAVEIFDEAQIPPGVLRTSTA